MVGELKAFTLPPEFPPLLEPALQARPQSPETKALEAACAKPACRRRTC
jgi:hypothetical protein